VVAKFIPRGLTAKQKENHLSATTDLLQSKESDPDFLGNIITGKETWIYGYNTKTNAQSLVWKSPSSPMPKKAGPSSKQDKWVCQFLIPRQHFAS